VDIIWPEETIYEGGGGSEKKMKEGERGMDRAADSQPTRRSKEMKEPPRAIGGGERPLTTAFLGPSNRRATNSSEGRRLSLGGGGRQTKPNPAELCRRAGKGKSNPTAKKKRRTGLEKAIRRIWAPPKPSLGGEGGEKKLSTISKRANKIVQRIIKNEEDGGLETRKGGRKKDRRGRRGVPQRKRR